MRDLIEYLERLGNGSEQPHSSTEGVCSSVLDEFSYTHYLPSLYKDFIDQWEHFSGSKKYPVPGGEYGYHVQPLKWENEQGAYRRDLCLFIARKLREQL